MHGHHAGPEVEHAQGAGLIVVAEVVGSAIVWQRGVMFQTCLDAVGKTWEVTHPGSRLLHVKRSDWLAGVEHVKLGLRVVKGSQVVHTADMCV